MTASECLPGGTGDRWLHGKSYIKCQPCIHISAGYSRQTMSILYSLAMPEVLACGGQLPYSVCNALTSQQTACQNNNAQLLHCTEWHNDNQQPYVTQAARQAALVPQDKGCLPVSTFWHASGCKPACNHSSECGMLLCSTGLACCDRPPMAAYHG